MKNKLITLFFNENCKILLWGIVVVLAVLLIAVIASPLDSCVIMYFTGEKSKLELIKLIGWGISGLVAILGVRGLLQRATALDEQNKMTEKGHIQERFYKATEHLGHTSMSVRIAAFNEFCHLVEIKPEWRKTIFEILCAHLRQTTKDKNYQPDESGSEEEGNKKIKPTEEVRSLLNILFKPYNKDELLFRGMNADLAGANLQGANLYEANLEEANLEEANLEGANLFNADMPRANLSGANLQKASINLAGMGWTNLRYAKLQGADLEHAFLQNADLQGANLDGADLNEVMINDETIMPDYWKNSVKRNQSGKTGVLLVDDRGYTIERF